MPRPSVRALDAGPVLPPGRVLRPGRPQGGPGLRRPEASAARAVEGGKPLVEDHLRHRRAAKSRTAAPASRPRPASPISTATWPRPTASRREQLARWITSKDNQYFAKSYVNRLWSYLFGRGIIEPIDDIRAGNPPTNPELLDRLTSEFIASGFDMQHMLRTICKSRTYQPSIVTNKWNEDDDINYSHAIARRLPAEVLYDAIAARHRLGEPVCRACRPAFAPRNCPTSGLTLPSGFFEVFGRPARESACECERSSGMMLGPVMTLVNGPTIADAIADPANDITKLVAAQPDDAKVVDELFLRILSRPATPTEIEAGVQALHASGGEHAQAGRRTGRAREAKLDARQAEWEARTRLPAWTALEPADLKSSHERHVCQAARPVGAGRRAKGTRHVHGHAAHRPGRRHGDSPGAVGRSASCPAAARAAPPTATWCCPSCKATAAPKADPAKAMPLSFARATADFSQDGCAVASAIDGNPQTGWAIHPQVGKDHVGHLRDQGRR